jgi:hypothetical protein
LFWQVWALHLQWKLHSHLGFSIFLFDPHLQTSNTDFW